MREGFFCYMHSVEHEEILWSRQTDIDTNAVCVVLCCWRVRAHHLACSSGRMQITECY